MQRTTRPWIPRSFQMLHRKVAVVGDDKMSVEGLAGQSCNSEARIRLDPSGFRHMSEQEAASIFWHELWHTMCSVMAWKDIGKNEEMADQFGGAMAQFMDSADWQPPNGIEKRKG
jgi:hypothetical protein